MPTSQGLERTRTTTAGRTSAHSQDTAAAYREARGLVVVLLAARLDEQRAPASARLLPIAARLANATLTPRRGLATPHLLRFLICLDELEAAQRIDADLAAELWRAAARLHRALQRDIKRW